MRTNITGANEVEVGQLARLTRKRLRRFWGPDRGLEDLEAREARFFARQVLRFMPFDEACQSLKKYDYGPIQGICVNFNANVSEHWGLIVFARNHDHQHWLFHYVIHPILHQDPVVAAAFRVIGHEAYENAMNSVGLVVTREVAGASVGIALGSLTRIRPRY